MASTNDEIARFFSTCDPEECVSILQTMRSSLSPASRQLCEQFGSAEQVPEVGTSERQQLAADMMSLLQWYGSNSITYVFGGGVAYLKIAHDVADLLNSRLPKNQRICIPGAAALDELEQLVVQLLLGLAFRDKTPEEIAAILEESGVGQEAARDAARRYAAGGAAGVAIPILVKLLGKRVLQAVIARIIVGVVGKVLGREAAEMIGRRLLVQATQKALAWWTTVIALAWTAFDLTLFASSPARRITVPTVTLISALRLRGRLDEDGGPAHQ